MTATLLAADLARIIDDAAIFASRDTTLPVINAVHLESSAKHLIATGTDRFALGSAMTEYDEAGPVFTVTLKLSQAQLVSKVAKSTRAAFTDVVIAAADQSVTFEFSSGETLTLPKLPGLEHFPDWRKIIENRSGEQESTPLIAINPQLLAKFGRVADARRMKVKLGGHNKPVLVSIGTQFVGVVMPIRLGDDDTAGWETPAWLARPKPPAKQRRKPAKKAAVA